MQKKGIRFFKLLKRELVHTILQVYPGMNPDISKWKGQEITDFQEELMKKVNAHISEKWFYTHMKYETGSLPRIDMLNLLSRYAGYVNWSDFIYRNRIKLPISNSIITTNRYFFLVPGTVVLVMLIFYALFRLLNTREYRFSFYDSATRQPITNQKIDVSLLLFQESPVHFLCDSTGTTNIRTDKSLIKMAVSSPCYYSDTITRILKKFSKDEIVYLHANDFALMIHYFSEMKVTDWQKRREQLDQMFGEDAIVYQVGENNGMSLLELYNKWEFINKLSVPAGSLERMEVLEIKYIDNRISVLKFRLRSMQ